VPVELLNRLNQFNDSTIQQFNSSTIQQFNARSAINDSTFFIDNNSGLERKELDNCLTRSRGFRQVLGPEGDFS